MNGKIKFFSKERFFGFIIGEDNKEYFFHGNDIVNEAELFTDDPVEFTMIKTSKGKAATNVELIK